jgi:hypothetical protein
LKGIKKYVLVFFFTLTLKGGKKKDTTHFHNFKNLSLFLIPFPRLERCKEICTRLFLYPGPKGWKKTTTLLFKRQPSLISFFFTPTLKGGKKKDTTRFHNFKKLSLSYFFSPTPKGGKKNTTSRFQNSRLPLGLGENWNF